MPKKRACRGKGIRPFADRLFWILEMDQALRIPIALYMYISIYYDRPFCNEKNFGSGRKSLWDKEMKYFSGPFFSMLKVCFGALFDVKISL